jgi:2-methylcitrate dehydratase PrpD
MLERITLRECAEFSRVFPTERQAVLRITTREGSVLTSPVCAARGDCDRPLSDEDLVTKFAELTADLGAPRSDAIAAACLASESIDMPVTTLLDLILAPLPTSDRRAELHAL